MISFLVRERERERERENERMKKRKRKVSCKIYFPSISKAGRLSIGAVNLLNIIYKEF